MKKIKAMKMMIKILETCKNQESCLNCPFEKRFDNVRGECLLSDGYSIPTQWRIAKYLIFKEDKLYEEKERVQYFKSTTRDAEGNV